MAKRTRVKDYDQFIVRLPPGMRERIAGSAQANDRSMNAEIVARIEDSFAEEMYAGGQSDPHISASDEFPPLSPEELQEMDRWNEAYKLTKKLGLLLRPNPQKRKH